MRRGGGASREQVRNRLGIFEIEGPLEFNLLGILVSVAKPPAEAKVSVFSISTYDTDYVCVKEADLERSIAALTAAGHRVKC